MVARAPPRGRPPVALLRADWSKAALRVLKKLDAAGYRSWIVGGAVRDALIGRTRARSDSDVATPARPREVMALFSKVVPTGVEHGTVTVIEDGEPVEVTTFRGEGAYLDGRRPSAVVFLDQIDADLARRDFTVNALAYDPIGQVLRDPLGGRSDLRRKILRAVGDPRARFAEDGLRPLRAARFAAQLGFEVDPLTLAAISASLEVTARVAAERVTDEFSRLLVAAGAGRGLELLDQTGLLGLVLPALAEMPESWRAHAYAAVGAAGRALKLRLAALLHVLSATQGDRSSGEFARAAVAHLRFPGQISEGAAALVERHGCLLVARPGRRPVSKVEGRRWLSTMGQDAPDLLSLWEADARALRPPWRSRQACLHLAALRTLLARVKRERPALSTAELALDGRAVMEQLHLSAGPAVGEALRHLLDRVLEEPRLNTAAALSSELRAWWEARTA